MNVYLDSVGCRLNQSEIETFAKQFRAAGHHLVSHLDQADVVVVNTCTVTSAAASDSRQHIRQAYRAGAGKVVVTGCWASMEPAQAASLPGVSRVVSNLDKERLVQDALDDPIDISDLEYIERIPIPGSRMRTRAFIKAQDGCNNRCTFCITSIARGPARSRPTKEVLADIQAALHGGVKEIVLTGVHLGAWGSDISPRTHLHQLIKEILINTDVTRLRISSIEPWEIHPDFFDIWQDERMCRHLHLPLQSGCAETLRRMGRKTTPTSFNHLVETARQAVPNMAITTDIIVGFPAETEENFVDSLTYVKRMNFARGHVFTYSERPGTAAAGFSGQVAHNIRKARSTQMRAVLGESETAYQRSFVGKQLFVLWEEAQKKEGDQWILSGLTDNYIRVHALSSSNHWNQITPVYITSTNQYFLSGKILDYGGIHGN